MCLKILYLCRDKLAVSMLEFKNVSVRLPDGSSSSPFSLVVNEGESICLQGQKGSGKTALLMAIMGLVPIETGFITIDGELVSSGSGEYFRKMIAYVPQHLPSENMTLREFYTYVAQLKVNVHEPYNESSIHNNMKLLGMDNLLINKEMRSLDRETIQLAMLAVVPLLKKKIILLDNLLQTSVTAQWISSLIEMGSEVIYTCETNQLQCHKIINI